MNEAIKILNKMVKDGLIDNYAIGGAVAAIYYLEPFDTADLDIFVQTNASGGNDLMIFAPIYDYLARRGYPMQGEHIQIGGMPVQFLPAFNPLTEEAIEKAQTVKYARLTTRIMRPEHLVAIMLDTGRLKDYFRINLFLESKAVNMRSLQAILRRHGLTKKWNENEYRFKP